MINASNVDNIAVIVLALLVTFGLGVLTSDVAHSVVAGVGAAIASFAVAVFTMGVIAVMVSR